MNDMLRFYQTKLVHDGSAKPGRVAMLMQDDTVYAVGPDDLCNICRPIIKQLGIPALTLFEPSLSFYNHVINKTQSENCIVPTDTETKTFLHDIPFIRQADLTADPVPILVDLLGKRKGVMIENLGIIAAGAVTLEQAYINASSLFHAVFVKYLLDLQHEGYLTEKEKDDFKFFKKYWLKPQTDTKSPLRAGLLTDPTIIQSEMVKAGRMTVAARLVDSSFGNLSCKYGDTIFISQTGASLDALEGCIDPVPLDNSSTCGITASSELLAHRLIYEQTGDGVILHGHPRFSVIMSMLCDNTSCSHQDCWRNCTEIRSCRGIPIVSGEIGAGGLAEKVSPVISKSGKVIVFGHGVFTFGQNFREAFAALRQTEEICMEEYFHRNHSNC